MDSDPKRHVDRNIKLMVKKKTAQSVDGSLVRSHVKKQWIFGFQP